MQKKIHLITLSLILIGGIWMTSCVSPYYGTARIEPGLNLNAGAALSTFVVVPICGVSTEEFGVRGDVELGYGIGQYLSPYIRLGGGVSLDAGFLDPGVGLQLSLPVEYITPALLAEINLHMGEPTFSPAFLLGIGRAEKVTLGIRTQLAVVNPGDQPYSSMEIFVNTHLSSPWSIFVGLEATSVIGAFQGEAFPLTTLGVGYSFFR
ncbi:hypothetical protein CEE36_09560 [candidate division TA06 bacterium B3_TA06]|uniref:Outer membrane protein beta-barrel domain-containing protein n=1 Tax=candidate division TA06 bacterium B3_TA06 TaxID=2012487 RepID=A0A532V0N9_UNCT6|nr:MAG: hypothetical protein CEE36_09560 [candidate division TA06 bacterium B3_TA06]